MEENLKTRLVIILGVLTAIFFISTVSSCSNAARQKSLREKEMMTRLDSEEKLSKFLQEKQSLESKLASANKALEEEKSGSDAAKKALLQEQLINQSLKDELQKVSKLKEALEIDLKEALAAKAKARK
jgi:chaperonin cofactor prefoldin